MSYNNISWSGTLRFLAFSIPVKLSSAVSESSTTTTHQYAPDGGRIRYRRVSEATGEEVAYRDIQKGFQCDDGNLVLLSNDDFAEAYGTTSRETEVLLFADPSQIPNVARSKGFIVRPGVGGERSYAAAVKVLQQAGKVAVLVFGIQQRKRLAVLSPTAEGYLRLEQLEWAEDIAVPDFTAPVADFSANEEEVIGKLAGLVAGQAQDFDYPSRKDDSRARLNALITSRIEAGQTTTATPAADSPVAQYGNLMDQLVASVEAVKTEKEPAPAKPKPARKPRAPRKPRATATAEKETAAA